MTINVIAEIGSNWGGDIELAKQHIKKSKDSQNTMRKPWVGNSVQNYIVYYSLRN